MKFEWDDQKAASNANKHGIRFEEAAMIFQGPTLDHFENETGEGRYTSIGLIRGIVLIVVCTLTEMV